MHKRFYDKHFSCVYNYWFLKLKSIICIIIFIVIAVAILGVFVYGKATEQVTFSDTEGITTVLTLEDEIQNDAIWCGTFQLIWNDLKNDLAKQDIVFKPQLQVIENLNKETFTTMANQLVSLAQASVDIVTKQNNILGEICLLLANPPAPPAPLPPIISDNSMDKLEEGNNNVAKTAKSIIANLADAVTFWD